MFHLSTLSHLAANAKNALIPRTPLTPLQNLQQINSSITKLSNLISTWSGSSLLSAAPISSQSATLSVELKNAIGDVKGSSSLSSSSSSGEKGGGGGGGVGGGEKEEEEKLLLEYITLTLRPNIEKCMQTMKSRKEEFGKCGLGGTVSGDLRDLRKLTGELGRSLRERVVGKGEMGEGRGEEDGDGVRGEEEKQKKEKEEEDESEKVMRLIDEDFEDAIQWFAS